MPETAARTLPTRPSLAGRLVLVAALWSLLVLAATGWGLSALFKRSVEQTFDRELTATVDALAATVTVAPAGQMVVSRPPVDPRFFRPLSGRYWQAADLEPDGSVRAGAARSRSLFDETVSVPDQVVRDALSANGTTLTLNLDRGEERLRIAARVIRLPDRQVATLLLVTGDRSEIVEAAARFQLTVGFSLVALVLGLSLAIFLQVRLGLQPLRAMGEELSDIRSGRRDQLTEAVPVELAPLAREINALIGHNQAVVERARTHVGNLAHALKTPLSVLRNEAAGRGEGLAEVVSRQTDAMARQVEHYLKRASAAARAEALGARAPIRPVVEDITRTLARLYRAEGVKLVVTGEVPDLVFRGEQEDLQDMVGNLAENACRYGGGLVEVGVTAGDGHRLVIQIDDD
ncbi:MAG: sensor histidine kinase N-terminal domain-containing protein, partial [Hyphomonadaceae bacterium]|nr:sensor histidine kinase N-terminal domain-containing protein [Hyphomonadaceae bacterium]